MKKSSIFWIVLIVVALSLFVDLLFHFLYFNALHNNIKPISHAEEEKAISILNQSVDLSGYQVKVWNVYNFNNKNLVEVDLIKQDSRKHYLIDLKEGKILRG